MKAEDLTRLGIYYQKLDAALGDKSVLSDSEMRDLESLLEKYHNEQTNSDVIPTNTCETTRDN